MEPFTGLVPPMLWKYFSEILSIPRLSKHEDRIIDFLLGFARRNNLEAVKDNTGNVVIRKPATPGYEGLQTVILQSHMDMVGEKDQGSVHNFMQDPIKPVRNDGWITATSTTLGADDGIGIAAQMLILTDDSLEHGELECLFTVDEESGMTGAMYLGQDFLHGSILLNLDSEDWGELFIGCAGGVDTLGYFHFELEPPVKEAQAFRVSVSGLRGGHSGDEIHKSPGNAIKILNTLLLKTGYECEMGLARLEGGNLRNAIPRDAYAEFIIPSGSLQKFTKIFAAQESALADEYKEYEPGLTLKLEEAGMPLVVVQNEDQTRFLMAIDECPHGVIKWSATIDDLVETSTNLASVRFQGKNQAILTTSQRSSVESAKTDIARQVAACFRKAGARTEHTDGYPGWIPDTQSRILGIVRETYSDLFNQEAAVRAIHAGLECGLILQKFPDLDMISFGPTIRGAHTPGERLDIDSTVKFWKLLVALLKRIPEKP